jgi:predicted Zn-dependent peptidase
LPAEYAKTPETKGTSDEKGSQRLSVVKLGFAAPPRGDEDGPVMDMLCDLLGGTGGRLHEQLEEAEPLATGVAVDYEPRLRSGSVVATAYTTPPNEEKVLKILEDELRRVIDTPLLYKDYRTSMNAAIGRIEISNQQRFARIRDVAANVLAGKGLQGALEYTTRIQDAGQDDLPEVARRFFDSKKSVTVRLRGRPE